MTKEKYVWMILFIGFMVIVAVTFFRFKLIPSTQTFGPSTSSIFGRDIPFSNFDIKFSCQPIESYFSEDSDISCKFMIKSKEVDGYAVSITAKLYSIESNTNMLNCTSTLIVNGLSENEGYCRVSEKNYFELPKGNYKISASKFTASRIGGSTTVTVEAAEDVIFRGTLHIMSSYEKSNKQIEDGVSIATLLAFIFIIPTAFIEIRRFLHEE
jgi:hypothetical protein